MNFFNPCASILYFHLGKSLYPCSNIQVLQVSLQRGAVVQVLSIIWPEPSLSMFWHQSSKMLPNLVKFLTITSLLVQSVVYVSSFKYRVIFIKIFDVKKTYDKLYVNNPSRDSHRLASHHSLRLYMLPISSDCTAEFRLQLVTLPIPPSIFA